MVSVSPESSLREGVWCDACSIITHVVCPVSGPAPTRRRRRRRAAPARAPAAAPPRRLRATHTRQAPHQPAGKLYYALATYLHHPPIHRLTAFDRKPYSKYKSLNLAGSRMMEIKYAESFIVHFSKSRSFREMRGVFIIMGHTLIYLNSTDINLWIFNGRLRRVKNETS